MVKSRIDDDAFVEGYTFQANSIAASTNILSTNEKSGDQVAGETYLTGVGKHDFQARNGICCAYQE